MKTTSLYEQLTVPVSDRLTPIRKGEAEFIFDFLKKNRLERTLEIGFAYGASAAYIVSAIQKNHIVIDPFQSDYDFLGMKNLRHTGLDKFVQLVEKPSQEALPDLVKERKKFDFVFIDGGHLYDNIFIDFYYADQLLDQNGWVMFHDSWMRSTQMVASWIRKNKPYRKVKTPCRNLVLFQKIGEDSRPWHYFKEFYTLKSIFSQALFTSKLADWVRRRIDTKSLLS
jgi:predicted O-methyltransferase YrrM